MKLSDDIKNGVYLNGAGAIVTESQFDREHPGLMDKLQPYIEDSIFINDDGEEEIDWGAVEKDLEEEEGKP